MSADPTERDTRTPTVPCPTCPWRKSSAPGSVAIPNFDANKARKLRCTVGDGSDGFRPIMACHYSPDGNEYACRGYVAKVGYTNLSVRVAAMAGRIPLMDIIDACADIDLHPTFADMLDAVCAGVSR